MLPLVEQLVEGLVPLAQNPRQRLGEVTKWMTKVVATFWLTLLKGPRAEVCWRTVIAHLQPLVDPEKFDVPTALSHEVVDGLSAADVASLIPKEFMNARLEPELLRIFQDFHFFLQTGQRPSVVGLTEEGEWVTQSDLKSRCKDEKAARKAWKRCTPINPKKKAKIQFGQVVSFRDVEWIDGSDGKRRQVGGEGVISPEDDPTSLVSFYRSSYGREQITKKMRVSFVARECMQGVIADFVSPADD